MGLMSRYRADIGTALLVIGVVTLAGLPIGAFWNALAPHPVVLVSGGRLFLENPEGKEFIAADGWFAALGAAAGALSAGAVYARYRDHGVGAALGLVIGGVLGALVAWRFGHALGPADVAVQARTVAENQPFTAPADVRAYGVLLLWPIAAATVFLALTAGAEPSRHDSLPRLRSGDLEPDRPSARSARR
ncbi:hypothetical protein LI90_1468 [Carbonactinospora thermoautotrophica]|uniref:ABC transporter permease n=2 Tax=Carbonactinospora thermoautotrophica TaxID=1469144 RepID=A0A132MQ31_9ACTN|nr:hypothetical protein LI90_1468 [Carbonactinospora thermoautotrophica]